MKNTKKDKIFGKMTVKLDSTKIPNKMHLDAQIMYPSKMEEDKSKYNRANKKKEIRKLLKEEF